jgi:hypothetical protein
MRCSFIVLLVTVFSPIMIFAQDSIQANVNSQKTDSISKWSFYAEGDYYIFPADQNIFMVTTTADKNMLHLEARYNYEDRNTASVFAGMNFSFGNQLKFLLTPMAGLVFGHLNGAAPGLEADLSYKAFDFSSQSEYVFDFSDKANDFAYTYLQLGATFLKKIKAGIAAQRTQAYRTNLDLQRGVFAGYTIGKLNASFTWFNPFTDSYFFVSALSINF